MVLSFLLLFTGFVLLILGGNFVIDGASSLARKLKVSAIIIGLTIVAFGTSAPEFFISTFSAIEGAGELALGNIIGSNITNILLVLAFSATICPLLVNSKIIKQIIPFLLFSSVLFWILGEGFLWGSSHFQFTKAGSVILLYLFGGFIYFLIKDSLKDKKDKTLASEYEKIESKFKSPILIAAALIFGFAFLAFGAELVVRNAKFIAQSFNLSEAYIGLTIVTLGTSLPELFTTAVAAYKKEHDVIFGNIVGSNIFNTVFVTGSAGLLGSLSSSHNLRPDIIIMIFASALLYLLAVRNKKITRGEGILLLSLYVAYFAYISIRG